MLTNNNTKSIRSHVDGCRQCTKTRKWVYRFTVANVTEEAAHKERWEARGLAYARILAALADAGQAVDREDLDTTLNLHPSIYARLTPEQFRALLKQAGRLVLGCPAADALEPATVHQLYA